MKIVEDIIVEDFKYKEINKKNGLVDYSMRPL